MAAHSKIVGGSTAKRVINCPGSVALVNQVPAKPAGEHADRGTLLHDSIAEILGKGLLIGDFIGAEYNGQVLTQELADEKLAPALDALDEIDPDGTMEFMVEKYVNFGDLLPDVFGSVDLLGRRGDTAVVLDWKFGDGVAVDAEENMQLMFYAAAAMRTPETAWAFKGVKEVELVIVQPPEVKRWTTTVARIKQFEKQLVVAVHEAQKPDAALAMGEHCRWCAGKPLCPLQTGAVERAQAAQIATIDVNQIGSYLQLADQVETWASELRALAHQLLEAGTAVPGYKLVNKRATRQWSDTSAAAARCLELGLSSEDVYKPAEILSPAQMEKVLKKRKLALPDDLVVSVSSGTTIAPESDRRPEVVQLGKTLTSALSKLN